LDVVLALCGALAGKCVLFAQERRQPQLLEGMGERNPWRIRHCAASAISTVSLAATPCKAGHAIFVREGVAQARRAVDEMPEVLRLRLISLRQFDEEGMMIGADVVDGESLSAEINTAFANARTSYIHLHHAKPGCFAACVTRA